VTPLATAALVAVIAAFAPARLDSPVADAAMRRDPARVRQLLRQGADVNAAQGDGMTALHWAATHGDADLVRTLVTAGARLEASTRNGSYTPLQLAAREGHAVAVEALLRSGANARATTSSGGATALHFAAGQGNPRAVAALLDRGALVNAREGMWDQTPLMWAAAYNRVAAIEVLVPRGADLKAVSKVENIPERDRADRAALQARNRRVAALKAAEQPAGRGAAPPPPVVSLRDLGFGPLVGDTAPVRGKNWPPGTTVGKVAQEAIAGLRERVGDGPRPGKPNGR